MVARRNARHGTARVALNSARARARAKHALTRCEQTTRDGEGLARGRGMNAGGA